jgi:hypothetical protein
LLFLRIKTVRVDMTPSVFLALCGLVKDALEVDSDAAPVLKKAAAELATALNAMDAMPEALERHADAINSMAHPPVAEKQAVA